MQLCHALLLLTLDILYILTCYFFEAISCVCHKFLNVCHLENDNFEAVRIFYSQYSTVL
jgi:hypothetical protein